MHVALLSGGHPPDLRRRSLEQADRAAAELGGLSHSLNGSFQVAHTPLCAAAGFPTCALLVCQELPLRPPSSSFPHPA